MSNTVSLRRLGIDTYQVPVPGAAEGGEVTLRHPAPMESLGHVRTNVHGRPHRDRTARRDLCCRPCPARQSRVIDVAGRWRLPPGQLRHDRDAKAAPTITGAAAIGNVWPGYTSKSTHMCLRFGIALSIGWLMSHWTPPVERPV